MKDALISIHPHFLGHADDFFQPPHENCAIHADSLHYIFTFPEPFIGRAATLVAEQKSSFAWLDKFDNFCRSLSGFLTFNILKRSAQIVFKLVALSPTSTTEVNACLMQILQRISNTDLNCGSVILNVGENSLKISSRHDNNACLNLLPGQGLQSLELLRNNLYISCSSPLLLIVCIYYK